MNEVAESAEKAIHRPRVLDPECGDSGRPGPFEAALLGGVLAPLLQLVHHDRDLIAEIRDDRLDIYCKGQRLIGVERDAGGYRFDSHAQFWPGKDKGAYTDAEAVNTFCTSVVPFIKQNIALHSSQGREVEVEQSLIRANNLEPLNTDYVIVDRQIMAEEGKGRSDLVGVYWPGPERRTSKVLAPVLFEVKYRLTGGIEGLAQQVDRYFNDLRPAFPIFVEGLQNQLRQKARLGLLSGLSAEAQNKIQRLPISEDMKHMRIVSALVDYNPRSTRLNVEQLRSLPFAGQIDLFYLGLGMWKDRSAFRGDANAAPVPS